MIITSQQASKSEVPSPRGGSGIMSGLNYITAAKRPAEGRVSMAAINTLPSGAGVGLHSHEADEEIYLILEGKGIYTGEDGSETPVSKGDVTYCRQGRKHALRNPGPDPLVFFAVIADSSV